MQVGARPIRPSHTGFAYRHSWGTWRTRRKEGGGGRCSGGEIEVTAPPIDLTVPSYLVRSLGDRNSGERLRSARGQMGEGILRTSRCWEACGGSERPSQKGAVRWERSARRNRPRSKMQSIDWSRGWVAGGGPGARNWVWGSHGA